MRTGSATEYGRPRPDELPLGEDAPLRPEDVYAALEKGGQLEESPVGKAVFQQLVENADIAREDRSCRSVSAELASAYGN